MTHHLRTELVLGALNMALGQRRPDGVVHHSDQGIAVHFARLRQAMPGDGGGSLDRVGRGLLRQRHGRELLCHAGVRAHRPALAPYPGRSAPGDLPIHRRLVQPTPSSFSPGLPQPQRLRAVRGEGNATCSAQRSSCRLEPSPVLPGAASQRSRHTPRGHPIYRIGKRLYVHRLSPTSGLGTTALNCPLKRGNSSRPPAFAQDVGRDAVGDSLRGLLHRIPRQMGVPGRGLDLAVA